MDEAGQESYSDYIGCMIWVVESESCPDLTIPTQADPICGCDHILTFLLQLRFFLQFQVVI